MELAFFLCAFCDANTPPTPLWDRGNSDQKEEEKKKGKAVLKTRSMKNRKSLFHKYQ